MNLRNHEPDDDLLLAVKAFGGALFLLLLVLACAYSGLLEV